jgi:two-component system, NarL family, response regulator
MQIGGSAYSLVRIQRYRNTKHARTCCSDQGKARYPHGCQRWEGDNRYGADLTMKNSSDAITQIRVLLADDHPVVRQGLATILKSQKDIRIIGEATDGEEACQLYDQLSPDVLILDLRMPKKDGLQVIAELMSGRDSKPRIIVMTAYETEEDVRRALKAGAKGYLLKGTTPQQIRDAVRRVAEGEALFPAEIALKLAESMVHAELSKRELQVLLEVASGRSNREIGRMLFISEGAVKDHVKSVLGKLGAKGRTEAVTIAMKRGLVRAFQGPAQMS